MNGIEYNLTPGLEDYLLAVNKLVNEKKTVRLKDISAIIGVTNASATSAISQLVERGFLTHSPYEYIDITPLGVAYAEEISRRRNVITKFFKKFINLKDNEIEKIVCKIEHFLSPFISDFQKTIEFFENNRDCYEKLAQYLNFDQHTTKEETKIEIENPKIIPLTMANKGRYRIKYFSGYRIELRLKQMGILPLDEIEVLSNQSGQVLIAKDTLRIGLGRGAAHHIMIEKI
ncbi:MAG: metal-dependent transcriptional regulator [Spirochaetales bacterium]|jgi:Mn-dependent DtxR family transcriptional regulator|nr:metal-dependent transcriptional regulator [Exilispira sp.]NMC68376.1 metal-dependent transcriptional regulator [Spirochaetales bacterium]